MKTFTTLLTWVLASILFLPTTTQAHKKHKIGIVAHRGFWNCEEAGKAQNSIASLKCAQQAGVWGSEFDVYMTSDEKLIVNHDAVFQGIVIESTPYEEIRKLKLANGEQIPNIDEYLTQGKKCKSTVLVYEVKSHKLTDAPQDKIADLSVQKIKKHKLGPNRVIFIAFSYRICKRIAEQLPNYTVQYLSSDKEPKIVHADGINGIDYRGGVLYKHQTWIRDAKNLGMSTNVWTINKSEEMKFFYEMGVDQITTDNPLEDRKILEEYGFIENKAPKVKIK